MWRLFLLCLGTIVLIITPPILSIPCLELKPLDNSVLTCSNVTDKGLNITTCVLKCNTTYKFDTGLDNLTQTCNDETGGWSYQAPDNYFARWRDVCTKLSNPKNRTSTTTAMFKTTQSCPNKTDINTAIKTFLKNKAAAYFTCITTEKCSLAEALTECIPETGGFKLMFIYQQDKELKDYEILGYFQGGMEYMLNQGYFKLTIKISAKRKKRATATFTAETTGFTTTVGFACDAGYGQVSQECKACPASQYLNTTNKICTECAVGTYTESQTQESCKSCPNGTSTISVGSNTIDDCINPCTITKPKHGSVNPPATYIVPNETKVTVMCDYHYSLSAGVPYSFVCSDKMPECHRICSLYPVPELILLNHNDSFATTLTDAAFTTVTCMDGHIYQKIVCKKGKLNWPQCEKLDYSQVGDRIYIIFIVVAALVVACFILRNIYIRQWVMSRENYKGGNYATIHANIEDPLEKQVLSNPIDIEIFPAKVMSYNRGGQERYQKEYKHIQRFDPEQKQTIGLALHNRRKNKERVIVPYDASRIRMGKKADFYTDYYNASFINGWRGPRAYIAAQTPMAATINDFWTMCEANMIRLVINLHPGPPYDPKSYPQYWPADEGLYGDVLVKNLNEELYDGFIIRTFRIGPVQDSSEESVLSETTKSESDHKSKSSGSGSGSSTLSTYAVEEKVEAEEVENVEEAAAEGAEEAEQTNEEADEEENAEEGATADDAAEDETTEAVEAADADEGEEDDAEEEVEGGDDEEEEEGGGEKEGEDKEADEEAEEEEGVEEVETESTSGTSSVGKSIISRVTKVAATILEEKIIWSHSFLVKQFHFTAWTEDDEPDKEKLMNFIYCTREVTKQGRTPPTPMIHSEIGSDWASIYIAVDYILDRFLATHSDINIIGVTNALRIQRPMMVSSLELYIYLYNFINYIILSETFEDMKYIGFRLSDMPEGEPDESLPTTSAEGAESVAGSLISRAQSQTRSVSRAASRQVTTASQSIVRSVSAMSQAILGTISETSDSLLSTLKEETAEESSKASKAKV